MDGAPFSFATFLALSFAKSEAPDYARVGCNDLRRIQELQRAGITPERMQACELAKAYANGHVSVMDLLARLG